MNLFPVNAAEVNGSNEVWSWYGSSELAVQAGGEMLIGVPLSGSASIEVNSSVEARAIFYPSFPEAGIALTSTGEALYGRTGSGTSIIEISSTADGTRWVLGESTSDIVFEAEGEAQVVAPAAASFDIIISSTIEERVTPAIMGAGQSLIELRTDLAGAVGRAVRLEASSQIVLASRAIPRLVIDSPPGSSDILLNALGDARFGRKVYLEPSEAVIELFSRGESGRQRYIYGEGGSVIAILAGMLQAGIPPIPAIYVPAPRSRTIIVQRDPRDMIVARENRSI